MLVGTAGGTPSSYDGGGTPSSHGGGYPSSHGGGYARYPSSSRPGQGVPRYPPPSKPGKGYPPTRPGTGYPHPDLGQGTPPPPMVNRQTFPSINITFPRTTYAGGKNMGSDWLRTPLLTSTGCKQLTLCHHRNL